MVRLHLITSMTTTLYSMLSSTERVGKFIMRAGDGAFADSLLHLAELARRREKATARGWLI